VVVAVNRLQAWLCRLHGFLVVSAYIVWCSTKAQWSMFRVQVFGACFRSHARFACCSACSLSSTVAVLRRRPTTACVKVHSALFGCCGELLLSKLEEASMRYGAFGMRVLVLLGVMASKGVEPGVLTTRRAVAMLTWCLDW
jgi:hypothetical protein